MNLVQHLADIAAKHPQRVAITERRDSKDQVITYGELYSRVCGVSRSLNKNGLRYGDKIMLLIAVGIDFYVILLGCIHSGMVPVLLDPSAGLSRMRSCLKIANVRAFIGSPKAHLLRICVSELRGIQAYCHSHRLPFTKNLSISEHADRPQMVSEDAPALLTFTSGSTGKPKAAMRTHGFLLAQNSALRKAIRLQEGEIDLVTLPVFVLANLAAGVTSVIAATPLSSPGNPHHFAIKRQCDDWHVDRCAASPAFFEGLLRGIFPEFKKVFVGGAPVFPDLLERVQKQLPNAVVTAVYGSTEAEPIADMEWIRGTESARLLSGEGLCCGAPVSDIRLKIIADHWGKTLGPWSKEAMNLHEMAQGKMGEIVVSGAHVLRSYVDGHGDEESKIRVGNDVWHRTGDAGYLDQTGRLWLLGRCSAKLPARCGFDIIYPLMIEAKLRIIHGNHKAVVFDNGDERVWIYELGWPEPCIAEATKIMKLYGFSKAKCVQKIPLDQRHQAKVDYVALAKLLKGSSQSR